MKLWAIKRMQQSAGLFTYATLATELTNANYMKFGGQVLADGTVIESVAPGEPIFAHDGDTWLWSGYQMRNNVYAIDPTLTNDVSATYEISVWDVAARSVDTNYPTTQITLNWRIGAPLTPVLAGYKMPPSWMPMTMLNISFDTNNLTVSVVDEAANLGAGVYPVLSVAPHGTYDPTKPWAVLDGTAYSRRLGWDDANKISADRSLLILNQITNAYGPDAGIWIDCVSHSPGLNAYLAIGKFGVNANASATNADGSVMIDPSLNAYTGIFGTTGSSTKWRWDGQMDHNTYAVSLFDITVASQLFSATYKVYVGDSSGNEILNADGSSASSTEVWTWQGPATVAPTIATQPISQAVALGSSVTFQVAAAGLPSPTFQWRKDGAEISGAIVASYTVPSVQAADVGSYDVVLVNSSGSVTSQVAVLSVALPQYSSPPTWMPMTMLNVTYDTNTYRLDVVDEAAKLGAGVYPVLSVAPDGTYDPTKPWAVLNGTAYSRRLGWDDANKRSADLSLRILNQITNAYGPDAGIWIDCVSHSPGLNAYLAIGKFGVNANASATNADGSVMIDPSLNAYSGIFGTAGSSTKWRWDGQMDHNTYAVSLFDITVTSQLFSATYKVYVGDSSGNEILNTDGSSASSTEVWTWQGPATVAPTIATQPISQAVALGSSVTFQVAAAGLPAPTFQWRKDGAEISGAIVASYTIPSVQATDAGGYDVVLVNSSGSVTSAVATLTVNAGVTPIALAIRNKVVVECPGTSTEDVVETAPALDATSWTIVTNPPVVIDGKRVILVDRTCSQQCFRLHSDGYCGNLVVNGGAEASPGVPSTSVTDMLPPAGWVTTGPITAAQYDGSGGFPTSSSPGPADRGANFLAGGRDSGMGGVSVSTAAQHITLAPFLGDIAGGRVGYSCSAFLGGYSSDNDSAEVQLSFLDVSSDLIKSVTLPAVGASDRTNVTGLLFRKTSGFVPAGAHSVEILLTFTKAEGIYNDGAADNIAFALLAPTLPTQDKAAIEWEGSSSNYVVETTPALDSPSWTTVTNTPVMIEGKTVILNDHAGSQGYFRLRRAP